MIRVVGMGNVLMGDDGFGPSVIHALECGWDFPEGVEVLDAGTPGLSLTPYLSGARVVILVDVAHHGGAPGEVRVLPAEDVLRAPQPARVSPHDVGLQDALRALAFAEMAPQEFRLVAAAPERVATGPGLTPAVRGAVEAAAQTVVQLLSQFGARAQRQTMPTARVAWWEAAAP